MPNCSHCDADLPIETLSAGGELACPSCGQPLDLSEEDWNLSSLPDGSPADATMQIDPMSDSSLAGSSLAGSDNPSSDRPSSGSPASETPSSEALSDDASSEATIDSGGLSDFGGADDFEPEATLVYGADSNPDDDDFDLDDESEEGSLFEEDDEPDGPSESLDATIDIGHQMAKPQPRPEDDATVGPGGLAGLGAVGDLTQMLGGGSHSDDASSVDEMSSAGEMTTDSGEPPSGDPGPRADATLATDSDRAGSDDSYSDLSGSSLSDSSSEKTELPSGTPDDATLQFDSDRRSGEVDTPEALDITGLTTGHTLPRGPLGEGRASASLKPGDSMLVGDESVRLRAFELSEADPSGAKGIDYAIEGEAGKGGMGVVYKARQQSLDRLVAIKQIKSEMGASDSDRNKFVSEAVITGQLEHPNIAPVHDLGLAADGLPFYAMKFVEGEDWEDSIKQKSEEENLAILIQVAQAIAFAHSKNILHRDLKPGNVRLGSFGEVLVMDWGLAARLDDGSEIQPAGTPIYMPPETALEYLDYAKEKMVSGKRVSTSRRRVPAGTYGDIYLLGALLFKIATGRAPHRGKTTFECLRTAAKNEIAKVRRARSTELLSIAYQAMATEPEDRHATALEFIEAIRAYQSHAQSIRIAKGASKDLREAGRQVEAANPDATKLYALFSSAQNGYQNALDLWDGNNKAARRLKKSKRMFAETAYKNGDYDLALSQLDESSKEDAELRQSVVASQKSRNARVAWFRTLQYATAASLVLALSFIAISVFASLDAFSARKEADDAALDAQKAQDQAAQADKDRVQTIKEAKLAVAEVKNQAKRDIDSERTKANRQIAKAISNANEEIAESEKKAAEITENAEQQVAEATDNAKEQAYYAAFSSIKALLSERGEYAAWYAMQKIDPKVVAVGSDSPEWRNLVAAVDWRSEATEIGANEPRQALPTLVASSNGGAWFATAAAPADGQTSLSVYRGGDETPTQKLKTPGRASVLAVADSGRYVALGGGTLSVIEVATGQPLSAAALPKDTTCLAFHPQRAELLVGRRSTAVERWSIRDGQLTRVDSDSQWHQTAVTAVGYSPDGTQRFSADQSGRVVSWRLRNGEWAERKAIAHEGAGSPRITAASMSDERRGRLAYGCDDGAVYECFGWWDASNADKPDGSFAEAASERLSTSHPAAVTAINYAAAGSTLLSAGGDTLLVRRSPTLTSELSAQLPTIRKERRYHNAKIMACAAGPEGFGYSSDEQGRVLRWKINVPPKQQTLQPIEGNAGVAAVRLMPSGNSLLVADRAGFVRTWEDLSKANDSTTGYVGHADNRGLRAWHLDGLPARVVTVASDNRACVWRLDDGLLERTIDLGDRTVVAVNPASRTLYAVSDGRSVEGASAVAWPIDGGAPQPLWNSDARIASILPLGGERLAFAIGLRDGQVYLWLQGRGRVDISRSSGRPHWRPITALKHDSSRNRFYSGDLGGLLVAWDLSGSEKPTERLLRTETQSGPAAIAKVALGNDGRVLVVQRSASGLVLSRFDSRLNAEKSTALVPEGMRDVTIDPITNDLLGIRRIATGSELMTFSDSRGWRSLETLSTVRFDSLNAMQDGWLAWGGGSIQWRPIQGGASEQIASRPLTEAFLTSQSEAVPAVTRLGSIDEWSPQDGTARQRRLGLTGQLLASCDSGNPDQVVLAIAQGQGGCRVELWGTAKTRRLRVLAELPTRPNSLVKTEGGVLALANDRLYVIRSAGEGFDAVEVPRAVGRPISAASTDGLRRLAIATAGGQAFIADRQAEDGWQLERLDREGISSVAFTPGGERLLVGVDSGRVLMLAVESSEEGVRVTRSVLALPGHSNRVTLLQVAPSEAGTKIVSGDVSGRVVVRSL